MIKPIVRDILFLSRKSETATKEDVQIIKDLQDTLKANRENCVGMAANMIGYTKNIIIVNVGLIDIIMINPQITKKHLPFETEEGCLSLDGVRMAKRYKKISVEFEDINFKKQSKIFEGWTAQIIQHEIDHCNGIVI